MLAVTRFVTTFPGGPTLFADSDGAVDVSMTDPFGRPWYMYRSREGGKPWYDQTPDANGRGTGILSTPPLPGSLFPGYAPWHLRTAEPDYLMGRRGVLGYDGLDQDLGMLLDAPQEARPEDSLSWWMKAGLLLDPVVDAWHGIGNWWNSLDTWDKKLRAGVGIGVAALGAAVAITALSFSGPMFFIGMALAGAAGYAGVNQAIHAADSNYDARSAARDMLIGGLAGLASAGAMLLAAGGAATLAAAYEGGGMLTVAGIEAAGGMAFGTTSSLLEGRSMQESLANGLAAATMAVVPTVAAMGLGRLAGSLRRFRSPNSELLIEEYGSLSKRSDILGQAHHLNQTAAYGDLIPLQRGLATKLQGNILTDVGAPHTRAHRVMELFWNRYRGTVIVPSNLQYTRALQQSLRSAGLSESQVKQALRVAIRERISYDLLGGMQVPRVPRPIRNLAE